MTPAPGHFTRAVILAAAFLALPLIGSAATVPGDYSTIQAAINAVLNGSLPDGTTINVQPGTYYEALVVSPSGKSFTIRGVAGAGATIVDASGKVAPALHVDRATGTVVIQGLTFRHGAPAAAAGGGFVITSASPSFLDCIFEANTASGGAGGAMFTSSPTFSGCIFRNNTARSSGGGVLIYSGSRPVFTNCDIVGNVSGTNAPDGVGGGVDSRNSSPTFRGTRISGNTSRFAGGGIYHGGEFGSVYGASVLVMEDSDVADNTSVPFSAAYNPAEGGGMHIEDNATASLTRVRILRNSAGTGGGLTAYRARYDIFDSVIDSNRGTAGIGGGITATSTHVGGTVRPSSIVNLTRTLVRSNVGITGGGIVVTGEVNRPGTLTLANSVVDSNQAQNQGGGILVSHAALTATNSMIIRNTVSSATSAVGGGIDITTFSSANISGTTIAHNTASQFGGGIYMNDGVNSLTMTGSNVYANTAGLKGAGVFFGATSGGHQQSGTIQNSIIADNNSQTTAGQINEDQCSLLTYQNNKITPLSGSALFSGCAPGGRATGTTSPAPRFQHFVAVPSAGTSMTLAWSVARASTVTISGVGTWTSPNNSPTGTVDVTPGSSATYTLTATATSANGGNYGPVQASFTVVNPPQTTHRIIDGDFDGDRKADVTVFRPSTGVWYIAGSTTSAQYTWGGGTDIPVRGDFDGDGKADVAIFRPSTGTWNIRYSGTPTSQALVWGGGADVPVPSDYDGDGKTDLAVFRRSNGTWYIRYSGTPTSATLVWGGMGDVGVPADYDGDGKADIAVFRPSNGNWIIRYSATPTSATFVWGGGSDMAAPVDYDGDGKADIAVFRPSNGNWFIRYSATPTSTTLVWGGMGDIAVPADYDGDGKADIAIFRRSNSSWYLRFSGSPTSTTVVWGGGSDIPLLRRP